MRTLMYSSPIWYHLGSSVVSVQVSVWDCSCRNKVVIRWM